MYGHGTVLPPPRPEHRGVVIGLRVVFTVLPVVSLGLLAWGSTLRLALVRKRPVDWVLVAVTVVIAIVALVLFSNSPDVNSKQANTGGTMLVFAMFCTPVYFLVMDIRRTGTPLVVRSGPGGYAQGNPYASGISQAPAGPRPQQPPYGYGHPRPAPPQTPPLPPRPPAATVPHPRIEQVRAELDELSDYLRKEEGR
ncbi:hypothetical protein OG552_13715 [Streptomyces sp. NBC_01476]|uniref:hypothetical protein n=1 Tax=Streptomyces sp. NBC_01476 TaxID=2903881 RepID=UPI002E357BDB|nr:hypothetical protein [Streptomyces sp. NBC_01476]